jgi:hypothetical protein
MGLFEKAEAVSDICRFVWTLQCYATSLSVN